MDAVGWDLKFRSLCGNLIPQDLIRYCIYSNGLNDPAHQNDHIYQVCVLGADICNHLELGDDDRAMVLAGCLMHDLGCRYDRKTHHLISYGLAYSFMDNYANGHFSPEEQLKIAHSCLQHRASFKGAFYSTISEIVALADRGMPDFDAYATRAVQFRLGEVSDPDVMVEGVLQHMLEKFTPVEGYAWKTYPLMGKRLFAQEWEEFTNLLLDPNKAAERVKALHIQLTPSE